MAKFIPPNYSLGDPGTLGGYQAVHDRPAAFEGPDGLSYSVEILADDSGDPAAPVGAYLLFLRWARVGDQKVQGHLESAFLARAASEDEAKRAVGALPLAEVKRVLDELVRNQDGEPSRKWWDAMRDDS